MLDFSFTELYSFVLSLVSMYLCYLVRSNAADRDELTRQVDELRREIELYRYNAE